MNKNLLLKLADDLDSLPPKVFDLSSITNIYRTEKNSSLEVFELFQKLAAGDEEFDCGSTACAIGYLPIFFPDKFRYIKYYVQLIQAYDEEPLFDFWAVEKFFGINRPISFFLFDPGAYDKDKSAKAVSNRIRQICESDDPEKFATLAYKTRNLPAPI